MQSNGERKLVKGSQKEAAEQFDTSTKTISRVWKCYKETYDPTTCPAGNVSDRKSKCVRKPKPLRDLEAIKDVPLKDFGDL